MPLEYATEGHPKGKLREGFGIFRSLRQYKRTPEYRAQLVKEGRKARLNAVEARTDMERRKARLRAFECDSELQCLLQGDNPSAFAGLIKFRVPPEED